MEITRELKEAGKEIQPKVSGLGVKLSGAIHQAVLQSGEGGRKVADFLHGTWLGHPLHPALTDIAIGAWAMGGVCDALGAARGDAHARRAGDRLTAIGCIAAIPTALSGIADFSTLPRQAASTATAHAGLNSAILGLYLLSLRDRKRGRRGRGLLFSGVALGLACVSAWLGGRLVYRYRVGVDHGEEFTGPAEWTPVLDAAELPERQGRRVEVDGKSVVLYREGSQLFALGAVCAHAGGPLEKGEFCNGTVQCPWHDSVFDLRSGRVKHGPATHRQAAFEARTREGRIEIRLKAGR